jgi:hypothetical protein
MPVYADTGKPNRHAMTAADVLEFRIKQLEEKRAESLKRLDDHDQRVESLKQSEEQRRRAELKRGKRRATDSPDEEEEPEGSASAPSPLAPIIGLQRLSLDCDRSPANSPADIPVTLPRPPLPDSAPPVRKTRKRTKPSPSKFASKPHSAAPTQDLTGPTSEEASTSRLLMPVPRQASRSAGNTSPASDDPGLAISSRIAVLEAKQAATERALREMDDRLKTLGG